MKALEILEAIMEQECTHLWLEDGSGYPQAYIREAIKELEDIEKEKFVDKFTYTSCEDCVNKDKDVYLEVCGNCRHFYGCSFEKKEVL